MRVCLIYLCALRSSYNVLFPPPVKADLFVIEFFIEGKCFIEIRDIYKFFSSFGFLLKMLVL